MIIADGWLMRLYEPYNTNPKLYVRKPGTVEVEMLLGDVSLPRNRF